MYVSGVSPSPAALAEPVGGQVADVLRRLDLTLQEYGGSLARALSIHVQVRHASDFAAMNAAYAPFFPAAPPVRTTVVAPPELPDALVQISAVAAAAGAPREVLHPAGWPVSPNPYSYAARSGDLVFLAGLVPRDGRTNAVVTGDLETQVAAIFDNAADVLGAAGLSLADVVSARVFLTDPAHAPAAEACYRRHMPPPRPARSTVVAALMNPAYLVEMTFVAMAGKRPVGFADAATTRRCDRVTGDARRVPRCSCPRPTAPIPWPPSMRTPARQPAGWSPRSGRPASLGRRCRDHAARERCGACGCGTPSHPGHRGATVAVGHDARLRPPATRRARADLGDRCRLMTTPALRSLVVAGLALVPGSTWQPPAVASACAAPSAEPQVTPEAVLSTARLTLVRCVRGDLEEGRWRDAADRLARARQAGALLRETDRRAWQALVVRLEATRHVDGGQWTALIDAVIPQEDALPWVGPLVRGVAAARASWARQDTALQQRARAELARLDRLARSAGPHQRSGTGASAGPGRHRRRAVRT